MDISSMTFNKIKKPKLSDQLFSELMELIAKTKMKPGDAFPTENKLIERFKVSRSVVREALQKLQVMGIIKMKTKVGATLCEVNMGTSLKHIALLYINDPDKLQQVKQFRSIIEMGAIDLVIKNITEEELGSMEEIVKRMKVTTDYLEYIKLEYGFHNLFIKASKSKIISDFAKVLFDLFSKGPEANSDGGPIDPRSTGQHEKILNALKRRDAGETKVLMTEHLKFYL